MKTGLTKVIGGRTYRLAGQYVGRGARAAVTREAKWLRTGYSHVRVVKIGPGWYRLYFAQAKR